MQSLKFLNSKEKGKVLDILKDQFGFERNLDYVFIQNQKDKIYLITRDIEKIDFKKVRINNLGLYFAEQKENDIRLSIEGSQIIGPYSKKNILVLNDSQFEQWIKGIDIDYESSNYGYFIMKHDDDYVGCGKVMKDKILNFIPKNRRLRTVNN